MMEQPTDRPAQDYSLTWEPCDMSVDGKTIAFGCPEDTNGQGGFYVFRDLAEGNKQVRSKWDAGHSGRVMVSSVQKVASSQSTLAAIFISGHFCPPRSGRSPPRWSNTVDYRPSAHD